MQHDLRTRVPHVSLGSFHVSLVDRHHPNSHAGAQRVQAETLALGNFDSCCQSSRTQMIRNEDSRAHWECPATPSEFFVQHQRSFPFSICARLLCGKRISTASRSRPLLMMKTFTFGRLSLNHSGSRFTRQQQLAMKKRTNVPETEPLKEWQQIASFLGLSVSLAQRWARSGMPVQRKGRWSLAIWQKYQFRTHRLRN